MLIISLIDYNERQKNIMNKIKEFFNPLNDEFSNKLMDTDEKISLTYNPKRGCQIFLEKKNGDIETLRDFENDISDHGTGPTSKNIDPPGMGSTSLLGGHKKRTKSQEREARRPAAP